MKFILSSSSLTFFVRVWSFFACVCVERCFIVITTEGEADAFATAIRYRSTVGFLNLRQDEFYSSMWSSPK